MDDIWSILGLEPTQDVSAIRRAYAQQTKQCHPEDDPKGFMRLRKAYQAALDWAEGESASAALREHLPIPKNDNSMPEDVRTGNLEEDEGEPEESEMLGWVLPEEEPETCPNPFENSEVIRQFLELYTGKQRKNPKLWMDYFTSGPFLDAAWEPRFTALLLEKVTELEGELPPNREFLTWLYVVYGFEMAEQTVLNRETMEVERRERKVNFPPGTNFDGIDSILRIASKGPVSKQLRGNEFAIAQSFGEYRRLRWMARNSVWNAQAMSEFDYMVGRYSSAYIKDRCEQRAKPDLERHSAGLRVFTHFFEAHELPEEVYRVLWQKLGLKNVLMGRFKMLYGRLREIVAERVPGINGEEVENFLALNRAHDAYRARIKAEPEREEEESATFFARPDLQKALHSRRFVEEQILPYKNWRREDTGEGLLRRMWSFYRENPDIPLAGKAETVLGKALLERVIQRRNREDAQAEGVAYYERLTLAYRPFFRHWLNTAWFDGFNADGGTSLLDYLEQCLPYQAEWSRRFLEREDGTTRPRTVAVSFGRVEVNFHLRHMEFRVNGRPIYRPCLPWEQTEIEGGDWFFYLLPITAASYERYDEVCGEVLRRLPTTAAPEEDWELIAECLAMAVCCLPLDEDTGEAALPEEVLPLKRYVEDGERLYGCVWMEGNPLVTLFEQTTTGRRVRRRHELAPDEDAMETVQRLLDEAVNPDNFDLHLLKELPLDVYVLPPDGPEYVLKQESVREVEAEMGLRWPEPDRGDVTIEALSELIAQFGKGELRRLELSWADGGLVFLQDRAGYGCFYFERGDHDTWYAMLSKPEVYQVVESDDVVYVLFGMSRLPDYVIHETPASILRNLAQVFWQLSQGRPQAQGTGGWLWDSNVKLVGGHHALLMAKQKIGGFPPHRGRNRLAAKFIVAKCPAELERVELDGTRTLTALKSGGASQASTALTLFTQSKLSKLRLSWEFKTQLGEVFQRHLVLLQDNGRFVMAWLRDDKGTAEYYTADGDNSGGEEPFLGQTVPAELVHHDLKRIRNCIDLLLEDMDNTDSVTERVGEFAPVGRPYELIRAELVVLREEL